MQDRSTREGATSFDLVLYLWEHRRVVIGITLLGFVTGLVASFVIRPLYRSEVIMFPAITNSVSKALLSESSTGRDDILALGDENDAEQLLQMLQSERIRERVTDRFALARTFRIKPGTKGWRTHLRETYEEHIKFEYTKFGSVKVSVRHPDPDSAALVANYIADHVDSVWKEMAWERAEKGFRIVEDKMNELEANIALINDSVRELRRLGVHDYHSQSERYNEYMGAAIVKGDQRAVREFEERFKVLAEYGGPYVTLMNLVFNENKRLSTLRMKLEMAKADRDSDLPRKFVVDRAKPSDKKAYPIRWLITAISTIAAFLLSLLLLVVRENVRKIQAGHGR